MSKNPPCKEISVIVADPQGDIETSLETWMRNGPGPRRFVTVVRVICKDTGEELPLSTIPLRYRNSPLSRRLIEAGILENPWKK